MFRRAMESLRHMVTDGVRIAIESMNEKLAQDSRYVSYRLHVIENTWRDITYADSLGAHRVIESATMAQAREYMPKAWIREYLNLAKQLESIAAPLVDMIQAELERIAEFERRDNAEKLEKWLSGESSYAPSMSETVCRVIGDTVETSRGARVPLNDALRVVKLAKHCRDNGETFARDVFTTGIYRGISIDTHGNVTIGCHEISWRAISECVARFKPEWQP